MSCFCFSRLPIMYGIFALDRTWMFGTMPPTTPSAATAPAPAHKPDWTLAYIAAGGIGAVAVLAMLTTPVADLLGDSKYAIPSTLHGIAALVYVILSTAGLYLAYLLYTGRLVAYRDLRVVAGLQAFFSLVTILFGNWIYIFYRAWSGPRTYFLENNASLHQIFFEFKEFVALFTLPLTTAAAFIAIREGDDLREDAQMRQALAVLLGLAWVLLMLAFGLGAAITKIRSV